MPTEEENIQYLYLVLTNSGPPQINWAPVCNELDLNQGAASKRWSRLKQAMESGKPAGAGACSFLWTVLKHSSRDKAMDWKDIAKKCNTTAGAAAKRYSRMKQAFEKGDKAPAGGPGGKSPTKTPTKAAAAPANGVNGDPNTTPSTPKRKRAPAANASSKKKTTQAEDTDPDNNDEDEPAPHKPKRARASAAKPRATKGTPKQVAIKPEPEPEPESESPTPLTFHRPANLPTPALSASVNPTEATTLIKKDPADMDVAAAGENEVFYPANDFLSAAVAAEDDDHVAQARIHEWLKESVEEEI